MRSKRMPVEPDAVPSAEDRLDSWKEIASYLRKGLRTVQRWERTEGLPVRRLGQGSVFAYKSELDAWWRTHSRTVAAEPDSAGAPVIQLPRVRRTFPKLVYAIALAGVAAALAVWSFRPREKEMYRAVPLTADHGWESAAAFSPDGHRIAYTWAPPEIRAHIYLKTIGSDTKTQLTPGPEAETSPAWSPDGHSIAFIRYATDHWNVMRIAETGGAETKIAEVTFGTKLVWTADGQWLIAVDGPAKQRAIVAISVADGAKHALTKPFEFGYAGFGISPDAKRLIFSHSGPGSVGVNELLAGSWTDALRGAARDTDRTTLDRRNARLPGCAADPVRGRVVGRGESQTAVALPWLEAGNRVRDARPVPESSAFAGRPPYRVRGDQARSCRDLAEVVVGPCRPGVAAALFHTLRDESAILA